jgi:hypothetical protein
MSKILVPNNPLPRGTQKKGIQNDSWKNWVYLPDPDNVYHRHAYITLTDSLIRYEIDKIGYKFQISLIFKVPWTGLCEGKTQHSSAYCGIVKKLYWEGRVDQFYMMELCPGCDPKIIPTNDRDIQERARKIKELEEVAAKLRWDYVPPTGKKD